MFSKFNIFCWKSYLLFLKFFYEILILISTSTGLKILRCCDTCDIVGIIKGEKRFKGAHWHCYRCRNGFNRRDEAIKHYKTHFRNPQTTFQIQITQVQLWKSFLKSRISHYAAKPVTKLQTYVLNSCRDLYQLIHFLLGYLLIFNLLFYHWIYRVAGCVIWC